MKLRSSSDAPPRTSRSVNRLMDCSSCLRFLYPDACLPMLRFVWMDEFLLRMDGWMLLAELQNPAVQEAVSHLHRVLANLTRVQSLACRAFSCRAEPHGEWWHARPTQPMRKRSLATQNPSSDPHLVDPPRIGPCMSSAPSARPLPVGSCAPRGGGAGGEGGGGVGERCTSCP